MQISPPPPPPRKRVIMTCYWNNFSFEGFETLYILPCNLLQICLFLERTFFSWIRNTQTAMFSFVFNQTNLQVCNTFGIIDVLFSSFAPVVLALIAKQSNLLIPALSNLRDTVVGGTARWLRKQCLIAKLNFTIKTINDDYNALINVNCTSLQKSDNKLFKSCLVNKISNNFHTTCNPSTVPCCLSAHCHSHDQKMQHCACPEPVKEILNRRVK